MTSNLDPGNPDHGPTGGPGTDTGPRVTPEEMRDLTRLRRSSTDRHIAGVAGGLGRHLDIDPVILRVAFAVFALFGGAGLLVYGACWLLVPADDEPNARIDLEPRTRSVALIVIGAIAALITIGNLLGGDWTGFWVPFPLLVVAAIVWFVVTRRDRRRAEIAGYAVESGQAPPPGWVGGPTAYRPKPRDPRKRGPVLFWYAVSLIALALGGLGIADGSGVDVADSAYPALALGIIAAMLLLGAFWGRAGGLILLGLVATVGTAGATAAGEWDGGQETHRPTSTAEVKDEYWVDTGELTLDLSRLTEVAALDGRTIEVGVGAGRIEVIVPDGMDVDIDARVDGPGSVRLLDEGERGGFGVEGGASQDAGPNAPDLTLDLHAGFGEIVVTTAEEN